MKCSPRFEIPAETPTPLNSTPIELELQAQNTFREAFYTTKLRHQAHNIRASTPARLGLRRASSLVLPRALLAAFGAFVACRRSDSTIERHPSLPVRAETTARHTVEPTSELQIEWLLPRSNSEPTLRPQQRLTVRFSGEASVEELAGGSSIGLFQEHLSESDTHQIFNELSRARVHVWRPPPLETVVYPVRIRTRNAGQLSEVVFSRFTLPSELVALVAQADALRWRIERHAVWTAQMYLVGVRENADDTLSISLGVVNDGPHSIDLREAAHRSRADGEPALHVSFFEPRLVEQPAASPPIAREGALPSTSTAASTLRLAPQQTVVVTARVRRPQTFGWFDIEYRNAEPSIDGRTVAVGSMVVRGVRPRQPDADAR